MIEEYLSNGKNIKNVKAYLAKAFHDDFRKSENEFDKLQKEKLQLKEEKQIEKNTKELKNKVLKEKYEEERTQRLIQLKQDLSPEKFERLRREFEDQIKSNEFFYKFYQTKGFENGVIQIQWDKFLVNSFLASEYHDFANYVRKHAQPNS